MPSYLALIMVGELNLSSRRKPTKAEDRWTIIIIVAITAHLVWLAIYLLLINRAL